MKFKEANKWEELYKKDVYQGRYPNEDVIRFIQKKFSDRKRRKHVRVLDWGSGTGRHMYYLAREGFLAYGVEVSESGIHLTRKWLRKTGQKGELHKIDGFKTPYPDSFFDAVIDCGSLQHNRVGDIRKIINEIYRILKPQGYIFSFCKAQEDSLFKGGRKIERGTYYIKNNIEIPSITHFFDKNEIKNLWSKFSKTAIEYTERTIDNMTKKVAHFLVSSTK